MIENERTGRLKRKEVVKSRTAYPCSEQQPPYGPAGSQIAPPKSYLVQSMFAIIPYRTYITTSSISARSVGRPIS